MVYWFELADLGSSELIKMWCEKTQTLSIVPTSNSNLTALASIMLPGFFPVLCQSEQQHEGE